MHSNKISTQQIMIITYFLSNASFLGIGINYILKVSSNDAVFAAILGFFLGFLFIGLLTQITKYTTKYNIIELNTKLMGKILGNIINLILIISFFLLSCIILWVLTNYINTQFLSNSPSYIISILFNIPILYALLKGQETLARTAQIFFIVSIFLFGISLLGLYNIGEIDNLKPFFKDGYTHILHGSFLFACCSTIPLFTLTIIPKNEIVNNINYNKHILIGYIISAISIIIVIYIILSVFGISVAKVFQFPEYSILKEITFFEFVEKIENIVTIKWLLDIFIIIFMSCFFVKQGIKTTINSNFKLTNIITIILIILVTFTPNMIFDKYPHLSEYIYSHYAYFLFIGILIPFIITYISILFNKNKLNNKKI